MPSIYTDNLNILYTLIFSVIDGASSSLRSSDILSVLILLHSDSKRLVGNITGVAGIAQLLVALPGGWLADRYRRDRIIIASSLVGLVSSGLMSLWLLRSYSFTVLYACMVMFGAYRGLLSGPLDALFADATTYATRSKLFSVRYIAQNVSWALGPFITFIFFLVAPSSDTPAAAAAMPSAAASFLRGAAPQPSGMIRWNVQACKDVLQVGVLLGIPGYVMTVLLDDRRNVSQAPTLQTLGPQQQQRCAPLVEAEGAETDAAACTTRNQDRSTDAASPSPSPSPAEMIAGRTPSAAPLAPVPADLEAALDRPVTTGFNVDFYEPVDLRVMARRAFFWFLPARSSRAAADEVTKPLLEGDPEEDAEAAGHSEREPSTRERAAAHPPRRSDSLRSVWILRRSTFVPWAIFLSDFIGALASGMTLKFFSLFFVEMCGMGPAYISGIGTLSPLVIALMSYGAGMLEKRGWGRLRINLQSRMGDILLLLLMAYLPAGAGPGREVLVVIHLLRMGFANSSRALLRAILLENVPSKQRARWAAVDSIRQLGWSGSAALGGVLVERVGYQRTFVVTAGIKLLAMSPLLLLRPLFE